MNQDVWITGIGIVSSLGEGIDQHWQALTSGARPVLDRETIVFREFVRGADLVRTGFGTSGPGPEAEVLEPDVLIMPLSSFDARGNRLGYGAGHYDRAIARLRAGGKSPLLVGAAFTVQESAALPVQDHDVALDMILTEQGLRSLSQSL